MTTGFRPVLRLSRVTVRENKLHQDIAKMLKLFLRLPAKFQCFPAGNVPLTERDAGKLASFGLQPGWPDLLIVHFGIFGIELKAEDGSLTKGHFVKTRKGGHVWRAGQLETFAELRQAGMPIAVCRSDADVKAALDEWNIPHLPWR